MIILAVLFSITAPLLIFYSLGWRMDFKTWQITQPGIFYLKATPRNCQVYIDGKLKKKTDLFFGTLMISNLPPKKYSVEIKKDGFFTWKKSLEIKKGEATEAKNIALIPENPNFSVLFKGIEKFFPSPNEKFFILKENTSSGFSLKLYEPEKNVKSQLYDQQDFLARANLTAQNLEIKSIDIQFSDNSKYVLLKMEANQNIESKKTGEKPIESENQKISKTFYYIIDLGGNYPSLSYFDFSETEIKNPVLNPADYSKLFVLHKENTEEKSYVLNMYDSNSLKIIASLKDKIIDYSVFGSDIYYLDSSGIIYSTDFSLAKREKLNTFPFPIKTDAIYEITASSSSIMIKEDTRLYFYSKAKDEFKKLSDNAKGFKFSNDLKRLTYFNNNEIWVLFLDKESSQPESDPGDQMFITRLSDEINKVQWFTDFYLVFSSKDKIKITEIDSRDSLNVVDLAELKSPEIFWGNISKKLYVLSSEALLSSDRLIQ